MIAILAFKNPPSYHKSRAEMQVSWYLTAFSSQLIFAIEMYVNSLIVQQFSNVQ